MRLHAAILVLAAAFSSSVGSAGPVPAPSPAPSGLPAPSWSLARIELIPPGAADAVNFPSEGIALEAREADGQPIFEAVVEGQLGHPDATLVRHDVGGDVTVSTSSNGKFSFSRKLVDGKADVELVVVDPMGMIGKARYRITASTFALETALEERRKSAAAGYGISVGLGLSSLSYQQTSKPDFSEVAFTAKAAWLRALDSRWDIGLSSYLTVLPLTSSSATANARYFGLNGRFGYVLPGIPEPWRVSILGGLYYTTMIVTGGAFGYADVGGPQIFPTVRRLLANGQTLSGYLKLSPITDGLSVLSLSNRELAVGVAWSFRIRGGRPLGVSFDFADLALTSSRGSSVSSRSVTVGGSYAF